MVVDRYSVCVQRVGTDSWRRDILHPVGQPVANRPDLAGLANASVVPCLFELVDLVDDGLLVLRLDVPTVRRPVVLQANRDTSVPVAVFALVDAGPAVGVAGLLRARHCCYLLSDILTTGLVSDELLRVGDHGRRGNPSETADGYGLNVTALDEFPHHRATDAQPFSRFLHSE